MLIKRYLSQKCIGYNYIGLTVETVFECVVETMDGQTATIYDKQRETGGMFTVQTTLHRPLVAHPVDTAAPGESQTQE